MHRTMFSFAAAIFLLSASYAYAEGGEFGGKAATPYGKIDPSREERGIECSKSKEPEKCEDRRKGMRGHFEDAEKNCSGKQGEEHHQCMDETLCAKAPDPQKCNDRAKERARHFQQMRQACEDKQGDDLRACMREQQRNTKPSN